MYFFPLKQTNKSGIFLEQKQTFFNCEKSLQANILNTQQARSRHAPGTHGKCYFYSGFHHQTTQTNNKERKRETFQQIKNRWGVVAPFYTLSFSFFFLFPLQTANYLSTTYLLSTYLFIFHLFVWRSLH